MFGRYFGRYYPDSYFPAGFEVVVVPPGGGDGGGPGTIIEGPDLTLMALTNQIIEWEVVRALDEIGTWFITIPTSHPLVNGVPLCKVIKRGWHVSLVEPGTHPHNNPDFDYFLFRGFVEDVEYEIDQETGTAVCKVSGSFGDIRLSMTSTPTEVKYSKQTLASIMSDIYDGMDLQLELPVNAHRLLSISFNADDESEGNGVISRLLRARKVAELSRWVARNNWNKDTTEYIPIDRAPGSQYVLANREYALPGRTNYAFVSDTPKMARKGSGIVNRVIIFGEDTYTKIDEQSETSVTLAEHRLGVKAADPPEIIITVTPTPGQTIIVPNNAEISGIRYRWVAGPSVANDVGVGSSALEATNNLIAAINGTNLGGNSNLYVRAALDGTSIRLYPTHAFWRLVGTNNVEVGGTFKDTVGNNSTSGDLGVAVETLTRPLTLQWATRTYPYAVQVGTNPNGSHYYFLQDDDSIALYGLSEVTMHRTDIKNPSDDPGTREAAANVLYQVAWGELLKNKSPKVFFSSGIGNGKDVWALPGDSMKVEYRGMVEVARDNFDRVVLVWEDLDEAFLVVRRTDSSSPEGPRQVTLVLAEPEVQIKLDALPKMLELPSGDHGNPYELGASGDHGATDGHDANTSHTVTSDDPWNDLPPPYPGGPGYQPYPNCCTDKTTSTTDMPEGHEGYYDESYPYGSAPPPALEWVSFNHFIPSVETGYLIEDDTVVIVFTKGIDGPANVVNGTNVTITPLVGWSGLADLSGDDPFDHVEFTEIKCFAITASGPGATWGFDGPLTDWPNIGIARANGSVRGRVTLSETTNQNAVTNTTPYEVVLAASASGGGDDLRDITIGFADRSTTALDGEHPIHQDINFLGTIYIPPPQFMEGRIGHTVGAISTNGYFGWNGAPFDPGIHVNNWVVCKLIVLHLTGASPS